VTIREIVKIGAPVLRQRAKKVHRIDDSIKALIADLIDTVRAAPGAGLAAPQIGVPLRVLVTNHEDHIRVIINPEIVWESEEEVEGDEGCLSIPGYYGPVMRKESVVVRYLGRNGKAAKIKAEDWEARILQHEIDHLNGILYIDRVQDKSLIRRVEREEEEEELQEAEVIT